MFSEPRMKRPAVRGRGTPASPTFADDNGRRIHLLRRGAGGGRSYRVKFRCCSPPLRARSVPRRRFLSSLPLAGTRRKLNDKLGGGSLTSLPVIETQAGDVSAYIPTNVISITTGRFISNRPFQRRAFVPRSRGHFGQRVGGNAQIKAMTPSRRFSPADMAQYRELGPSRSLAPIKLDKVTQGQLAVGNGLTEILSRISMVPLPVEEAGAQSLYCDEWLAGLRAGPEVRRLSASFCSSSKRTIPRS